MTAVAREYAEALYGLARDEGVSDRIREELRALRDPIGENAAYLRLLGAPNIAREERCGLLRDCLQGRVHPYVLNFLRLLTEKGAIRHFSECCDAYQALYNEDHDILVVRCVRAVPLTRAQRLRLTERLERLTGKRVELTCALDAACLGGLRLDYDGLRLDDTVRHRLDVMRERILNHTTL